MFLFARKNKFHFRIFLNFLFEILSILFEMLHAYITASDEIFLNSVISSEKCPSLKRIFESILSLII